MKQVNLSLVTDPEEMYAFMQNTNLPDDPYHAQEMYNGALQDGHPIRILHGGYPEYHRGTLFLNGDDKRRQFLFIRAVNDKFLQETVVIANTLRF